VCVRTKRPTHTFTHPNGPITPRNLADENATLLNNSILFGFDTELHEWRGSRHLLATPSHDEHDSKCGDDYSDQNVPE
jgi:hypothetical protein